ncbi:MAG: thiamine pyrophosphate-binding protein, partial [Deltaproteobacteria bacterium]|nr:thiamine pyrophosphate-binding protein [Deltaproteobacteria bacterium]
TELANNYAKKADLILAVGTRFEEEETAIWLDGEIFSVPPTKIIQIDINPIEIGKNYPVELGLIGDAKLSLASINKEIRDILKEKPVKRGTKEELKSKKEEWFNKLKPFINSDKKPINPRRLLYALNRYLPENGIIVLDPSWARIGILQQFGSPGLDRCYIAGGVLPIGWSTASSLGVGVGRRDSRVISIIGDGGFLMTIQSLLTAKEYELPITYIIINNKSYNALDVLQKVYFGKSIGSKFENPLSSEDVSPNYSEIAKAFHIPSRRVEEPNEIEEAIQESLTQEGPFVLDLVSDPEGSKLIRSAPVTWSYFWSDLRKKRKQQ